jgi:FkbH-like protein
MTLDQSGENTAPRETRSIKCVIWDLDETIWSGVLLEDDRIEVKDSVVRVIKSLDDRGILHSVASRNDHDRAIATLEDEGLREYFLVPQIGWGSKSHSVAIIASELNIGLDSVAFIDDQEFERAEVAFSHPDVLTISPEEVPELVTRSEFSPETITDEAKRRRRMYQADLRRRETESEMSPPEFLATLDLEFTISHASSADLARIEELTTRTSQLNSTGEVFSERDLEVIRTSADHSLLIAELTDRFGSYGKIGVAIVEHRATADFIRIFLMSCRVMSRGVGTVFLGYLLREARNRGVLAEAVFRRTPRNRPMYLTFKMSGFQEVERQGDLAVVRHDGNIIDPVPSRVRLVTPSS